MLSDTLNTNEVKNAAGAEVELTRQAISDRETVFKQIACPPSSPHLLSIKHAETGSGLKQRRRSLIRIDKTVVSSVDSVTPVTVSAYMVLDAPVGALSTSAEIANVLAELMSFVATSGGTTVLYDCTGNGATVLLNGSL